MTLQMGLLLIRGLQNFPFSLSTIRSYLFLVSVVREGCLIRCMVFLAMFCFATCFSNNASYSYSLTAYSYTNSKLNIISSVLQCSTITGVPCTSPTAATPIGGMFAIMILSEYSSICEFLEKDKVLDHFCTLRKTNTIMH